VNIVNEDAIINLADLGKLAAVAPTLLDAVTRLERQVSALRHEMRPPPPTRSFLTLAQTAEELNLCTKTVTRLIQRGLLKASKGTRVIRVPFEEIEAYRKRTV
jgi:hypothetical protein